MSVILTGSGLVEFISPTFINDLIAEISNLPATFDEDLAYLCTQQCSATIVCGARTNYKAMFMIYGQFEDSLIDAMEKLRDKEPDVFRRLVEKHPGAEALADLVGS